MALYRCRGEGVESSLGVVSGFFEESLDLPKSGPKANQKRKKKKKRNIIISLGREHNIKIKKRKADFFVLLLAQFFSFLRNEV
jgi:hypothetical protein